MLNEELEYIRYEFKIFGRPSAKNSKKMFDYIQQLQKDKEQLKNELSLLEGKYGGLEFMEKTCEKEKCNFDCLNYIDYDGSCKLHYMTKDKQIKKLQKDNQELLEQNDKMKRFVVRSRQESQRKEYKIKELKEILYTKMDGLRNKINNI